MPEPRLQMGRVGERTPPPGLIKDLKGFDPNLTLSWSSRDQNWVVTQETRRKERIGEFKGGLLYAIRTIHKPVLWIEDAGEPDRRIFPLLAERKAEDRRSRLERTKRRLKRERVEKEKRQKEALEPGHEAAENSYYDLRSKGILGPKPSYVPRSLPAAT